ncbi:MAG: FAD-dependent monooxygenase [Solirubrobacteraceae bacterium]
MARCRSARTTWSSRRSGATCGRTTSGSDSEATRYVTARYLVGADGANSSIRQIIGSEFHDWQRATPTRPTTIVSGGPGRRRWEFMRLPGEEIDDLNTAATAWRLLEPWGIPPDTVRPDFYVYGTAATAKEVPALVDALSGALNLSRAPTSAAATG